MLAQSSLSNVLWEPALFLRIIRREIWGFSFYYRSMDTNFVLLLLDFYGLSCKPCAKCFMDVMSVTKKVLKKMSEKYHTCPKCMSVHSMLVFFLHTVCGYYMILLWTVFVYIVYKGLYISALTWVTLNIYDAFLVK